MQSWRACHVICGDFSSLYRYRKSDMLYVYLCCCVIFETKSYGVLLQSICVHVEVVCCGMRETVLKQTTGGTTFFNFQKVGNLEAKE